MGRNLLLSCGRLDGTWWTDPITQQQILVADSMAGHSNSYSRSARYVAGKVFITQEQTSHVSAYTPEGNLLWEKYMTSEVTDQAIDFADLGDGTIALLGYGPGSNNSNAIAVIFNPTDGTIVRQVNFPASTVNSIPRYFDGAFWAHNGTTFAKYDLFGVEVSAIANTTYPTESFFVSGYLLDFTNSKVFKINTTTMVEEWMFDIDALGVGGFAVSVQATDPAPDFLIGDGRLLIPTYLEDSINGVDHKLYITEVASTGVLIGTPHLIFSDLNEGNEIFENFTATNNGPYLAYFFASRANTTARIGSTLRDDAIYGLKADWTVEKLFQTDLAYTTQLVSFPDWIFSGTVKDNGVAAECDIHLLHVPTKKIVDKTRSVGGIYILKSLTDNPDEHCVIAISTSLAKNWQIRAHLSPEV